MKQRIISAMVGLVILFSALSMYETAVPNIAISLIAFAAVWELLNAAGCTKNKPLSTVSLIFSASIPFFPFSLAAKNLSVICYLYVVALFIILLATHEKLHVRELSLSFLASLLIPFSLTAIIYMRDRFGVWMGLFYTLLIFGSAWLSDTGAYFAGRFFGKRKLAPVISPKKTVEGAIGGIILAMITVPLVLWAYIWLATTFLGAPHFTVSFLKLLFCIPFLTAVSILGDLSASIIKRQYGVKDYGSVMPGHGGVMDRFDSVLMVAPLVYIISQYLPLVRLG